HDEVLAMELDAVVGELNVAMDEFDLEEMMFHVDEAHMANVRGSYVITGVPGPPADTTEVPLPDLMVGEISMENMDFKFEDQVLGMMAKTRIGNLEIEGDGIDLENQLYDVQNLVLEASEVQYQNNPLGQSADMKIGTLEYAGDKIDLNNQIIDIRK